MNWLRDLRDLAILAVSVALPAVLQALADRVFGDDRGPGPTEGD